MSNNLRAFESGREDKEKVSYVDIAIAKCWK